MMNKRLIKASRPEYATIQAAVSGDANALNAIVNHYDRYILRLSTKKLFAQDGNIYRCIDEDIRRQLQTKLVERILRFKLQ